MNTLNKASISTFVAALAFAAGQAAPVARADDTEVFFTPVGNSDQPNILFLLDSSGTMANPVPTSGSGTSTKPAWDTTTDWLAATDVTAVGCQADRLYWITSGAAPTTCTGVNYVQVNLSSPDDPSNKFVCKGALDSLSSPTSTGYVTQGSVAQYNTATTGQNSEAWIALASSNQASRVTECLADDGAHGINSASTETHPNNGTADGFGNNVDPKSNSVYSRAKAAFTTSATFYTADRIAWESIPDSGSPSATTRMEALKAALATMVTSVTGVRVGLMRFDNNSSASRGGMVVKEMVSVDTGAQQIINVLYTDEACNKNDPTDCQKIFVPFGNKAIGETLFEAYRYFAGGAVDFGSASNIDPNIPFPSVDASIINPSAGPGQKIYRSPASECGKNYIVLLTDGLTSQDTSRDTAIANLPNFLYTPEVDNFGRPNAACDAEDIKVGPTGSACVDDLPGYMWVNDVNTAVSGIQNVKTYTVGFDLGTSEIGKEARQVLRDAARRGGGTYYDATDQKSLEVAFNDIVREILIDNASFTAPSVAVNAFNRTQNLNDLYMSVFKPSLTYRWFGNVKKYRLTAEGAIVDADGNPAVDVSTGFFATGTRSFWSDADDGPDAALGGAAGELKLPASRTVYTNVSDSGGTLAVVDSGTLSLPLSTLKGTAAATVEFANKIFFNVDAPAVPPATYPTVANLVDWAYGFDVLDKVGTSGTTTDPRLDMGDPLHARPATVIYGGPATAPDTTIFATTNDGVLHAINSSTGAELWAFAPVELLPRIRELYDDDGAAERVYGLDGSVKAYRIDNDQDGTIEEADGDQVLLFFGMRRGGSHVYALDVTVRTSPKLLWRAGAADDATRGLGTITSSSNRYLPGIGQTWSSPTITRMNIDRTWSSGNSKKLVAVVGGGYDVDHDTKTSYADDNVGNRIYILDAITGARIWSVGPDADNELEVDEMVSAIPGDIRSFDLTGDGFDDRMYASDLGGRIWRFDIVNGEEPDDLVVGGLFATLGVGDSGGTPDSDNRKFFYAPDASLIRYGGRSWINIAIGSGDRERPVSDTTVDNRFYSLRDYNIFTKVASDMYLSDCSTETGPCHQIITASDTRLTDVTTDLNPALASNAVGWYLNLEESGEKALAESRTFQNSIYFTTYAPSDRNQSLECGIAVGVSKLWVVSAINARPVINYDTSTDGVSSLSDRNKDLAQGAIAPEVVFVFPTPDSSLPGVTPPAVPPVCLVGLESCGGGISNPPVRTYWRQRGSN